MRLQIISDLHIDINRGFVPTVATGIDALIVAGDVCEGIAQGFSWLRQTVPARLPIVMVAGNHEHYGRELEAELELARVIAADHRITFLENATASLGAIRVIGTTLWTDYELFGADRKAECMAAAATFLSDHQEIRWRPKAGDERSFRPGDALALHQQARAFLARELACLHAGPVVVVTHHGPHEKSVARQYAAHMVTPAFVSDLADVIAAGQPALWVHGHTHTSFDYCVGATRVVCNPLGYGCENPAFDPVLVVEV
jgi:DNA repair exonuclease SbcCD nuclease subunit